MDRTGIIKLHKTILERDYEVGYYYANDIFHHIRATTGTNEINMYHRVLNVS